MARNPSSVARGHTGAHGARKKPLVCTNGSPDLDPADRRLLHAPSHSGKTPDAQGGEAALIALFEAMGVSRSRIEAARRERDGEIPLWIDRLIAEGVVGEAACLAQVAARIDATFCPLPPPPCTASRAGEAFTRRLYWAQPGQPHGRTTRVMAPDGRGMLRLLTAAPRKDEAPPILTTRQALLDAVVKADAARIARRAATTLPSLLSARQSGAFQTMFAGRFMPSLLVGLVLLNIILFGLAPMLLLVPLLLSPVFIIAAACVLLATWVSLRPLAVFPLPDPADLPAYSVLVPLYREAEMVPALVRRLMRLSYPREKLEIIFLVEEGDEATRAAFAAMLLPAYMLVLIVPKGMPQTKPRALNVALPLARGDYLVIFDAEDVPEADQLLKAAAQFAASPQRIACLQARIAISNVRDGFLSARFAIEYAALFDCIKAGTARLGWPVPLGGTSNHFRVSTLRNIGGWDAWNVTEDADLGLRLARFGWQVADLPSTTWEEAPNTLSSWLNQRTRWLKGWFQTLSVHSRRPKHAIRQFGYAHTLVITSIGVAFLIGALFQPFFVLALGLRFLSNLPLFGGNWLWDLADGTILLCLAFALLAEVIPALVALHRRRGWWLMPLILCVPASHALIFVAAWRGLREWVTNPFHWHKTRHGLAKTDGGMAHPLLNKAPARRDETMS